MSLPRRRFLAAVSSALASCAPVGKPSAPLSAPKPAVAPKAKGAKIITPLGAQVGDVTLVGDAADAVVWCRASRPSRMQVAWSRDGKRTVVDGPLVDDSTDLCGHLELHGLPRSAKIAYEVTFIADDGGESDPVAGTFSTPGDGDVRFAWSGDTCGQGYGIDLERGGLRIYDVVRKTAPDFFLHSGDLIYADAPIPKEIALGDGSTWRNVVTAAKSHVAQTLADFRGNFAYNLLDEHLRKFHREVPQIVQWDDHEVRNNWWPGQVLDDERYDTEPKVDVLSARAKQAMFEYTPIRRDAQRTVQRVIRRGPLLDLFVLDARTFRSKNGDNTTDDEKFLGSAQLAWLREAMAASKATWKVIACDQPVGLVIKDLAIFHEGMANDDPGPPKGREKELASLLSFLHGKKIQNVVFLTADVHYAAAHHYEPSRAAFAPFFPFWEFVAGPLWAGNFGPSPLDATFGPKVMFQRVPPKMNLPPIRGWASFGTVDIDAKSHAMTVTLHDGDGGTLWAKTLLPVA